MKKNTNNMTIYQTIDDALRLVVEQKKWYDRNLLNKTFSYVYIDKPSKIQMIDFTFKAENYLHLTGLDYRGVKAQLLKSGIKEATYAYEFYNGLDNVNEIKTLVTFPQGKTEQETQSEFYKAQTKLNILPNLTQLSQKAEYIGNYNGNIDLKLIINRNMCSLGLRERNNQLIPTSLLRGKIEQFASNFKPVLAIFCKEVGIDKQFELTYLNKSVRIGNAKFDRSAVERLSEQSFHSTKDVRFNEAQLNKLIEAYNNSSDYFIRADIKELSSKREMAFETDDAGAEYEEAFRRILDNIDTERKREAAIQALTEQKQNVTNNDIVGLIDDEISEINKKFSDRHIDKDAPSKGGLSQPNSSTTTKTTSTAVTAADKPKPNQIAIMNNGGSAAMTAYNPFDVLAASIKNFFLKLNNAYNALADLAVSGLNKLVGVKDDAQKPKIEHTNASNKNMSNSLSKGKNLHREQISPHLEEMKKRQPTKGKVADEIERLQKEIKEKKPSEKEKNKDISL